MRTLQAKGDASQVDKHGASPLHTITDANVAERLIKARTHGAPHDANTDLREKVSTDFKRP